MGNIISSITTAISTMVSSANQGRTARELANAENRKSATTYRMLPLIILAAVVLAIVFTKK